MYKYNLNSQSPSDTFQPMSTRDACTPEAAAVATHVPTSIIGGSLDNEKCS